MVITKHSLRILRYIYHQKSVSYLKLKKKFKVPDLDESLSNLVRACYVIQGTEIPSERINNTGMMCVTPLEPVSTITCQKYKR